MGQIPHTVISSCPSGGSIARDCHAVALELLAAIRQETSFLKGFRAEELLELLPTKEFLLQELASRMKDLHSLPETEGENGESHELSALKSVLSEVKDANHLNQVFIQGTLEYWQGLMDVFFPPSYGHPLNPSAGKLPQLPRGFSFSKEI